jgi:hypothetical protein
MSKSTNRYGEVLFSARVTVDANPTPTKKQLRQRAKLESAAKKEFNKSYDNLTEKQKSDLHGKLAILREHARQQRSFKEMNTEARLDQMENAA